MPGAAARGAGVTLPTKLKLKQTVQADYVMGGSPKGKVQVREGTEFHPDGIEGDRVFVDLGKGDRLYAPLSATNYEEATAADKRHAEAMAGEALSLSKDAVALEIKIGKLVPAGISSQEKKDSAGAVIQANTFVASVATSGLKEGEWWKGQAFPIGTVAHPNTGEAFDCYTGDLGQYHAFKIGQRDLLASYMKLAKEQGARPKLGYDDFAELATSLKLDRALQMSAGLAVTQPDEKVKGDEWGFEVSNEQILRLKAKESRIAWLKEIQPVWIKASEVAGFWLKNREMSVPVQRWLKLLQETTLKFNSNEISGFRQAVQKLNDDWVSIQATSGR
jgi:hypothetical protein